MDGYGLCDLFHFPLIVGDDVMTLLRAQISSTAISGATYDDETEEMEITFTSGQSYTFNGVPKSVFEGLEQAGSPGQYYHQNIKGRYT